MAVDSSCPVCRTADIVCAKWTLLLVRDLAEGRSRFCELERSLTGISPRTLSLRLRALEEEGVVHRQTFAEVPPRVEYALTEKGMALVPIIDSMRTYGAEWLGAEGSCAEEFTEGRTSPPPHPDHPTLRRRGTAAVAAAA
jgi:DNA-binding HxlR family transcriptional regulator